MVSSMPQTTAFRTHLFRLVLFLFLLLLFLFLLLRLIVEVCLLWSWSAHGCNIQDVGRLN